MARIARVGHQPPIGGRMQGQIVYCFRLDKLLGENLNLSRGRDDEYSEFVPAACGGAGAASRLAGGTG
jgi:hypothetical protein